MNCPACGGHAPVDRNNGPPLCDRCFRRFLDASDAKDLALSGAGRRGPYVDRELLNAMIETARCAR